MVDVQRAGLAFNILLLLVGCSTTPIQQENSINSQNYGLSTATVVNSVNENYTLDSAIFEGSKYLISRINSRAKIAIINIQSPSDSLANYVIDSLLIHLVNEDKYYLIERNELNILEREQQYQLSGAVSDETAVSIGKQLGTQFIITGSILPLGDRFSLRLKVINIETAQIIGTQIYQVISDRTIMALLESSRVETSITEQPKINNSPQTVIQGDVNITNNNTTTIQGDVYVNMPQGFGW